MPYKDVDRRREYAREWIRTNPAKAREAMRRWRERHPSEHAASNRSYYERHKQELAPYFAQIAASTAMSGRPSTLDGAPANLAPSARTRLLNGLSSCRGGTGPAPIAASGMLSSPIIGSHWHAAVRTRSRTS